MRLQPAEGGGDSSPVSGACEALELVCPDLRLCPCVREAQPHGGLERRQSDADVQEFQILVPVALPEGENGRCGNEDKAAVGLLDDGSTQSAWMWCCSHGPP